jgi:uncharacterized membrane protein YtjA (UPF0391 family)
LHDFAQSQVNRQLLPALPGALLRCTGSSWLISGMRNHPRPYALQKNWNMETAMLFYALAVVAIALVAGLFGFFGMAGMSASIAQILIGLFLAVFVLSLIAGMLRR